MFDFKDTEANVLMQRKAEIAAADMDGMELEELRTISEELTAINAELEARKAAEAERRALAEAISEGVGTTVEEAPAPVEETIEETRTTMTEMEIRKSSEYEEAYARYLKSEDDREVRALLSENATNGTVPVPAVVYDIIKTAWERDGITSRVRKAYLRGNLKVGFEISSDGAIVHTEGGAAIDPENLVLGIVELKPVSIKKAIQITDEALDLSGRAFLEYIYDELTYQIAKKAADTLLDKIFACGTASTTTQVAVAKITSTTISVGLVAQALSHLSDEAENPVVILNKATWGAFKAAQAANGYNYDPFEGLPVIFNNHVTAFSAATTGVAYVLVGDLNHGALMNFPNGDEINITLDRLSLKKQDLVEVFGREFVGIEPVAPFAFCKVVK